MHAKLLSHPLPIGFKLFFVRIFIMLSIFSPNSDKNHFNIKMVGSKVFMTSNMIINTHFLLLLVFVFQV